MQVKSVTNIEQVSVETIQELCADSVTYHLSRDLGALFTDLCRSFMGFPLLLFHELRFKGDTKKKMKLKLKLKVKAVMLLLKTVVGSTHFPCRILCCFFWLEREDVRRE